MCKQFFFFSSRRRHTRYIGDWSSDVCSSDLFERASVPLPTIANVTIPIVGRGTDARSNAALGALRDRVVPERSEERRVGKECRCQQGRGDEKIKEWWSCELGSAACRGMTAQG